MDFDEYVTARYGRLIEHAVLLGCAEGEAGTHVDRVLLAQRRRITRADDPDPLVHEALERSISGLPERRRRLGPLVAVGLVLATLGVGVALTYRPAPEPMPSLFGLTGDQAQRLLTSQGYDVALTEVLVCEPPGQVLGSDPIPGTLVREGAAVHVRVAAPSDSLCDTQADIRSDAWAFVAFALGGAPPELARTVRIVVDEADPTTLSGEAARDPERWGGALAMVADEARRPAPTTSGMPRLTVHFGPPPEETCGVARPATAGERPALRLAIDPRRPADDSGCPLTVDLYRDSNQVIDAVVFYQPRD